MKKPIILIDCDDVLADFTTAVVDYSKNILGREFLTSNEKSWDYFDYEENKEISDQIWDYIHNTQGFCYNLRKFDYADELLEKLRQRGHVIACTSLCTGYFPMERTQWLIDKCDFSVKEINLGHPKYLLGGGDVFIDDRPDNIIKWVNHQNSQKITIPVIWGPPNRSTTYLKGLNLNNINIISNIHDLMELPNWKCIG